VTYTTPPTRLQKRLPAKASSDKERADVSGTLIYGSESKSTNRFSRTPSPDGVIGKAEIQMIIGTITNNATVGMCKCNPHANAITCNTQSALRSIDGESVRETK